VVNSKGGFLELIPQIRVWTGLVLGNINNDPDLEIIYGDYATGHSLDMSGSPILGWPVTTESFITKDPIVADVNNDNIQDLIFAWESYDSEAGIKIYSGDGIKISGLPDFENFYNFPIVLYNDMECDGFGELICYNQSIKSINVFELQIPFNSSQDWPTKLHDNQSTNNYNAKLQSVDLFNIADFVINEDEVKTIRIASSYLDWNVTSVLAKSDTSSIELEVTRDLLSINPEKNWFGTSTIQLFLRDGENMDTTSFVLNVLPDNDLPNDFSILSPLDSSKYIINENSLKDSIIFNWQSSQDAESETILYNICFQNEDLEFMNKDSIIDTVYALPIKILSNHMYSAGIIDLDIHWNVECVAGIDTVSSINGSYVLKIKNEITTGLEEIMIPQKTHLSQNYPNPFNPTTKIEFGLQNPSNVSLKIYNLRGELIRSFINKKLDSGYHYKIFDGKNLESGIYFYRLETNEKTYTKKMMFIK